MSEEFFALFEEAKKYKPFLYLDITCSRMMDWSICVSYRVARRNFFVVEISGEVDRKEAFDKGIASLRCFIEEQSSSHG